MSLYNITNLKVIARRLNVELDLSDIANSNRQLLLRKIDLNIETRTGAFAIVLMNMLGREYKNNITKNEVVLYGYMGALIFNKMNHIKDNEQLGNLLVLAAITFGKINNSNSIIYNSDIAEKVISIVTEYQAIRQQEKSKPNLANVVLGKVKYR